MAADSKQIRLWKHVTKKGTVYLSGPMSRVTRLLVVPNEKKEDDKDPDFLAYIVPNRGSGPAGQHLDSL